MHSALTDLRDAVSDRVLTALDDLTSPLAHVGAPLAEFLAPARSLLGGGKRLRALLCGAGWACASPASGLEGPVVLAGSALELFQGAALVHDDVMDGSLTRRGMPAAHRRFAGEHAERGWLGSADAYGQAGAIVLGDMLLSLSSMEMDAAQTAVGPAAGRRARRIYDAMTAEVALGQYLDIRSQAQPWEDDGEALARALQVVRHKSARYSVEHPLLVGAALAGADDDLLAALSAVGLPLGEAFQLRDDELGVFGDPGTTGKPAGDDLREGKRTVLLAMTVQRAGETDRALIRERVGAADLGGDEVAHLQGVMRATGAVEAHERMIEERHRAGLDALEALALPAGAETLVRELAAALTRRSA